MLSTEQTVFHSNLHYLLSEASTVLGFSIITAGSADIISGLTNTSFSFIQPLNFPLLLKEKAVQISLPWRLTISGWGKSRWERNLILPLYQNAFLLMHCYLDIETDQYNCILNVTAALKGRGGTSGNGNLSERLKVVLWIACAREGLLRFHPSLEEVKRVANEFFILRG